MILNYYLAIEFFKAFFFSSAILSLIIQIGHLFDRLEVFIKHSVPIQIILLYLFSMLPFWLVQALPICTLIAGVTAIGNMSRTGEIFCLRSSGISSTRILKPFIFIGLALTILTFILGDTLMPKSTAYARNLYRTYVDKEGIQKTIWNDIIVLAKDKKRISAKRLDISKNEMETVTVEEYGNHLNLRQALTAKKAEWNPQNGWTFYDGVIRLFSKEGNEIIEEESFATAQIILPEKPGDLVPLQVMPEELSMKELNRYIQRINGLGISALREIVQYHLKLAFPFTHILVLGIGLPIAFKTTPDGGGRGKKAFGRMKTLAVALLIALGYYMLMTVGVALGESRKVIPWVGVWIGNFVFAVFAVYSIRKID